MNAGRQPVAGQAPKPPKGLARMRLPHLLGRFGRRHVLGVFAFANGLISIGLLSLVAWITREPFVFPSLGPTAFLLFYSPNLPAASPRNTVLGHLIGVLAGFGSLALFGLLDAGPATVHGVTLARVGAAALSLAVTAGAMAWLDLPHPPAGATTLIVGLGILTQPLQLVVLMVAVVVLTLQGIVINRLAGLDYPLWSPKKTGSPA